MKGDIHVVDGVEMVVIWDGGEGLVPSRETKVSETWTAPGRLYNKTGKHAKSGKKKVDNREVIYEDLDEEIDND
jgi:hypothetical protein